jgi:hypothetical protein
MGCPLRRSRVTRLIGNDGRKLAIQGARVPLPVSTQSSISLASGLNPRRRPGLWKPTSSIGGIFGAFESVRVRSGRSCAPTYSSSQLVSARRWLTTGPNLDSRDRYFLSLISKLQFRCKT